MAASESDRGTQAGTGRFDRRMLIAGSGAMAGVALAGRGQFVAEAATDGELVGIGMTIEEFTDLYGEPVAGQGARVYTVEGDEFFVANTSQIQTDRVVSVCWGANMPEDALPIEEVRAKLVQFLPSDAELREICDAPGFGIGPRLLVEVYHSRTLRAAMKGSGFVESGNMLIACMRNADFTGDVPWANLYVGVKPEDDEADKPGYAPADAQRFSPRSRPRGTARHTRP